MKRKTIITTITVIIIAAAAYMLFGRNKVDAGDINIETAKVTRGTISEQVSATGTLQVIDTVEVGTQVSGIVDKIYVDYNSPVKKGQLIAKIDTTNLAATLEQSKAALDNAKADLEFQQANYNRLEPLIKKNLISQSDFDQVVYNLNVAKANYNSAMAQYKRNKINLDYAFIYSPINGIVTRRAVQEGQTVAASFNTPTLFVIANDLTQMQVVAKVDEADIGKVKEGQRAEFTVDAYPDRTFSGTIKQIRLTPSITNNVVTYTVIILAPNPDKKLMPGMTATIEIYVKESKDLLVIPSKAIRFTMDDKVLNDYRKKMKEPKDFPPAELAQNGINTKTVWVKKDSLIRPVQVKTGLDDDIQVQILSGLKPGEEVITGMEEQQKVTEKKKVASNPFMPHFRHRENNQKKGNS